MPAQDWEPAVLHTRRVVSVRYGSAGKEKPQAAANRRRTIAEMLDLQGLPGNFLDGAPWTMEAKGQVIANGVPLPMGRAIARAVKRAVYPDEAGS